MFTAGDKLEGGHYTVLKQLGQGGMGVVYHCHDEILQRDVAVKMLLPELLSKQDTVETFHQEARLAAQLEHPNIVTIYDIGRDEHRGKTYHYIAMEFLPGGNLSGRIAESELSIEHKLNWMKQLAAGLNFAHKRGVVHQDIKADNIFITEEGDLKIGDFGLARIARGRPGQKAVSGMGTPAYMSPELCRGEEQDHRSDIYSMGILFFEIATGDVPYKAKGMIEMAMKHASAPIPSARKANPQVSEVLDKTIQRMMAKTAEERFQSMADVLAVLDDLIFELRLSRLGLTPKGRAQGKAGSGFFAAPQRPGESKPPAAEPVVPRADRQAKLPDPQSQKAPVPPRTFPIAAEAKDVSPAAPPLETPAEKKISHSGAAARSTVKLEKEPAPPSATGSRTTFDGVKRLTRDEPTMPVDRLTLLWSHASAGPIGWKSGPVLSKDGVFLYVNSADGRVYALDAVRGRKIWSFQTGGPLLSSPVSLTDRVIVAGADSCVYALSSAQGHLVWKCALPGPSFTTPGYAQDTAFIATMSGEVIAVDVQSGYQRWVKNVGAEVVALPVCCGPALVIGTKSGSVVSLSTASGQVNWTRQVDGPIVGALTASADSLYVGAQNGAMYAMDLDSGRPNWVYETSRPVLARAVVAFNSVIFGSLDRWLYCCDKYDGRLIWKVPLRGRVFANLVSSSGAVHATCREGFLQSFSQRTGELRWQHDFKQRLESPPFLGAKTLYISTIAGETMAFALGENMLKLAG